MVSNSLSQREEQQYVGEISYLYLHYFNELPSGSGVTERKS